MATRATTMRILGWKTKGLRCPDHEIDCCLPSGDVARILLVQMPNGTGKTTTLTLLRAALSGAAHRPVDARWNSDRVRELQKRDSDRDDGFFELWLSHNDKRITIRMEFDFEAGRVHYKTTRGAGQENGFSPPRDLKRFMEERFVNYYVFDGELAEDLLSPGKTDAETAVENLFQLRTLTKMGYRVSEYWSDQTGSVTATSRAAYTRRKNLLARWKRRSAEVIRERNTLNDELDHLQAELDRKNRRYRTRLSRQDRLNRAVDDATSNLERRRQEVNQSATDVLDEMRGPHTLSPCFGMAMSELKSGLDRLKLPESVAREFFDELSEEMKCICGRPIDDNIRAVIGQRAALYLSSDDVTLLNSLKLAVSDAVGESPDEAPKQLSETIENLADLVDQQIEAKNEYDQLKVEAERVDPTLQRTKEQIDALQRRADDVQRKLQRFRGKDDSINLDRLSNVRLNQLFAVETIEAGIARLKVSLAEITETQTLLKKCEVLRKIIDDAAKAARQAITNDIRDEANRRIQSLMPNNNIRIQEIDGCLHLESQSRGSTGEDLSIAYAFLSTLFNRADQHHLPFIVDSPANSIDLATRPNIARLVPKLTRQFIGFVISSERDGFIPNLKRYSEGDIGFITLFRKGTRYDAKAENYATCRQTIDGISVSGEEFFNDFQMEQESL